MQARKFPDVIARSTYPVDIHNPEGTGTLLKRLPPGEAYDIPLRCLLPREIDGLLLQVDVFRGLMKRTLPTASCRYPWPRGRPRVYVPPLRLAKRPPRAVPFLERPEDELIRQGANLGGGALGSGFIAE